MDLSTAYDCLPHNLLLAKLETDGLDYNSLALMLHYLTSRKQRTKLVTLIVILTHIFLGIPQFIIAQHIYK